MNRIPDNIPGIIECKTVSVLELNTHRVVDIWGQGCQK